MLNGLFRKHNWSQYHKKGRYLRPRDISGRMKLRASTLQTLEYLKYLEDNSPRGHLAARNLRLCIRAIRAAQAAEQPEIVRIYATNARRNARILKSLGIDIQETRYIEALHPCCDGEQPFDLKRIIRSVL